MGETSVIVEKQGLSGWLQGLLELHLGLMLMVSPGSKQGSRTHQWLVPGLELLRWMVREDLD